MPIEERRDRCDISLTSHKIKIPILGAKINPIPCHLRVPVPELRFAYSESCIRYRVGAGAPLKCFDSHQRPFIAR